MNKFRKVFVSLSVVSLMPWSLSAQNPPGSQALSLKQAVELALKNNPTVKASDAYSQAVRRGIAVAKAGRYPRLDFSEGFTRGNNPVYVFGSLLTQRQFTMSDFALSALNTPSPLDNFLTQFTATVPLYDAGQIRRMTRDARLQSQIAERQEARTEQEIIFQVIHSYTDLLLAQEGVRVAQAEVEAARSDLNNAQARTEQGMAVPSDLLSAQVEFASAQEDLLGAQNAVELARAGLNVVLGFPESASTNVEGQLTELQLNAGELDQRESRALTLRPDYLAARLGRERADNGTRMARAEFLPKIGLFSSWALANQTFATRGGNNWMAGAQLSFNIFDGGANRSRVLAARDGERQAEALVGEMEDAVRLQVKEAYLNLTTATKRIEVARDAVAQSEESLRILQNRYTAGLATMSSVLQAETAHTAAEKNYLNALYDYRLSFAALDLSTGELTSNSPVVLQ